MPMTRTLRGRLVKRTHKHGDQISVWLAAASGIPAERLELPFAQYEREIVKDFFPQQADEVPAPGGSRPCSERRSFS